MRHGAVGGADPRSGARLHHADPCKMFCEALLSCWHLTWMEAGRFVMVWRTAGRVPRAGQGGVRGGWGTCQHVEPVACIGAPMHLCWTCGCMVCVYGLPRGTPVQVVEIMPSGEKRWCT